MTGISGLNRIHGQRADSVGELGVIDVFCFWQDAVFILAGAGSRRRVFKEFFGGCGQTFRTFRGVRTALTSPMR